MAREGLGIAEVYEPLDQLESIVKFLRCLKTSFDCERQQGAGAAIEILLCEVMVRVIGKTRIIDPVDLWVPAQEFGHRPAVFYVAFYPQRDRLDPLQEQECAKRGQHRTCNSLVHAPAA